ncbi:hypothetical protein IPA_08460 [Ignicoccus pacificus DSM 13166]|uniref:Uncharacterized protein n=1 Tax=Ignicoccus pacificus DSM 13166 TaxID=940294 RepID=A0A977PLT5_9CREN|nr:hypothetical protein IPA_08460 [Ignicoccus pacificus DSM 13166]
MRIVRRKGLLDLLSAIVSLILVGVLIYLAWLYYNKPQEFHALVNQALNATKNALGSIGK